MPYRIRLTYSYSSAATATTVASAVDAVLAAASDPVIATRVNRSAATLELKLVGLTPTQAQALYASLRTAAHTQVRTGGKLSLVLTPDVN